MKNVYSDDILYNSSAPKSIENTNGRHITSVDYFRS